MEGGDTLQTPKLSVIVTTINPVLYVYRLLLEYY